MAQFVDKNGTDWQVNINGLLITRIRENCDEEFLLGDAPEHNTAMRVKKDPVILCVVIYILCTRERELRGINIEDFYALLDGDTIQNAAEALLEAIVNFTPPERRIILETCLRKGKMIEKKAMEIALRKVNDPSLEEKLLKKVNERIDADLSLALTELESASDTPDS